MKHTKITKIFISGKKYTDFVLNLMKILQFFFIAHIASHLLCIEMVWTIFKSYYIYGTIKDFMNFTITKQTTQQKYNYFIRYCTYYIESHVI